MRPVRILYLIDSLGSGGAQRQLVTLVNGLDRERVAAEVAVYHPHDHFRPELERTATPIHQLGTRGGWDPRVVVRLARLLRSERYDIVHSYLKTPGVLARVAAHGCPGTKIVVSERSLDLGRNPVRLLLERALVGRASTMIVNAESIRRHVERLVAGWRGRVVVVPNGIEWTEPGAELAKAAEALRGRFLNSDDEILLGVVGRLEHPKDPHLLLDALAKLEPAVRKRLRVVWVGAWNDPGLLESVGRRIEEAGLDERVTLTGPTREVRAVYLAIDAFVLPSASEGFPNVVLEAMSDARPVVSTDVGDAATLVVPGRTGWLVDAGDSAGLAGALTELARMSQGERSAMGRAGAERVRDAFSTKRLVESTMKVYETVLSGGAG